MAELYDQPTPAEQAELAELEQQLADLARRHERFFAEPETVPNPGETEVVRLAQILRGRLAGSAALTGPARAGYRELAERLDSLRQHWGASLCFLGIKAPPEEPEPPGADRATRPAPQESAPASPEPPTNPGLLAAPDVTPLLRPTMALPAAPEPAAPPSAAPSAAPSSQPPITMSATDRDTLLKLAGQYAVALLVCGKVAGEAERRAFLACAEQRYAEFRHAHPEAVFDAHVAVTRGALLLLVAGMEPAELPQG